MNGAMDGIDMRVKKSRLESETEMFDAVFPELVDVVYNTHSQHSEIEDATNWFREVCEYNVPFGKKTRGMTVVMTFKHLVPSATELELHIARVLGWCVEWLQAFFLVADDLMDQSLTRRGKPCWYKLGKVGMEAVNDSVFLESCIYQILKKFIRHKPYYIDVVELFHETVYQTTTGQCLDMTTAPPSGCVDFTHYTMERYNSIVKWKTSYYSFYLPVATALYMAGIGDSQSHENAKAILLPMGNFFQVQDDFLDCFGEPSVIGKIGTDIQENKCSWLVVTALNLVNKEQRLLLQENYGSWESDKVAKVKSLYKDLDLEQRYRDFEEETYQRILELIDKHSGQLPRRIFETLVEKIYKRKK